MSRPRIHLATVVGGYVKVLPHMLEHYRALGIDSIFINAHLARQDDPNFAEVQTIANNIGCGIHSASVYDYTPKRNTEILASLREKYPKDWFVLADQDELQLYDDDVVDLVLHCERNGYDYVEGCLLDRVARDGSFPPVTREGPIWQQFPLGGFIGYPLLGAYPKKVVISKGHLRLGWGQHGSYDGHGLPVDERLVQVHHFKWVRGLRDRLAARAQYRLARNQPYAEESLRFLRHLDENGGRLRFNDSRFLIWDFELGRYKHWNKIKEIYKRLDNC